MYFLFPLIGLIGSWIGLNIVGPPRVYGEWNFLSILLWVLFVGFVIRLGAAIFGIAPEDDNGGHHG